VGAGVPAVEEGSAGLAPATPVVAGKPAPTRAARRPGQWRAERALTGTGWASREISIDANAALLPVIYFATEIAPAYLRAAQN